MAYLFSSLGNNILSHASVDLALNPTPCDKWQTQNDPSVNWEALKLNSDLKHFNKGLILYAY